MRGLDHKRIRPWSSGAGLLYEDASGRDWLVGGYPLAPGATMTLDPTNNAYFTTTNCTGTAYAMYPTHLGTSAVLEMNAMFTTLGALGPAQAQTLRSRISRSGLDNTTWCDAWPAFAAWTLAIPTSLPSAFPAPAATFKPPLHIVVE